MGLGYCRKSFKFVANTEVSHHSVNNSVRLDTPVVVRYAIGH
jgi:hypothetical protein